jgi:hypothetical protein
MGARQSIQPVKEERMLMYVESSQTASSFGSVRRPIQCEGAERGHRRAAEVASYGAVNPQGINWGQIASTALPLIASLF